MSLTLYLHPLASFCWKVLIALYENDTPFTPHIVDLGDPDARAAFLKVWPMGKFPVLRDEAAGRTIAESTTIIEHLALHHGGATALVPANRDRAQQARFWDRFYDLYVHHPMQKIVTDKLRPAGAGDAYGVEEARSVLATAYEVLEQEMATRSWAAGPDFGLADCAAAPALYYADRVQPLAGHRALTAYLERLKARASFARVLREAEPYFASFPG